MSLMSSLSPARTPQRSRRRQRTMSDLLDVHVDSRFDVFALDKEWLEVDELSDVGGPAPPDAVQTRRGGECDDAGEVADRFVGRPVLGAPGEAGSDIGWIRMPVRVLDRGTAEPANSEEFFAPFVDGMSAASGFGSDE